MAATLVRGEFAWDVKPSYPGYYDPTMRWNGFAVPGFTRAVADRVMRWNQRMYRKDSEAVERVRWSAKQDAYLIDNPVAYPGEPPEVVEGVDRSTVDGPKHLYFIGGMAWTWFALNEGLSRRRGRSRRRVATTHAAKLRRARGVR